MKNKKISIFALGAALSLFASNMQSSSTNTKPGENYVFAAYNWLKNMTSTPSQRAYEEKLNTLLTAHQQGYPPAQETYQKLNSQKPFVTSIGISMSQTEDTNNTIHPEYLKTLLAEQSQKQNNPQQWLKERHGYVVRSEQEYRPFTTEDKKNMVEQLHKLGVFKQKGAQGLPAYRLSIELADIVDNNGNTDNNKLQEQAEFLSELGNPLTFMHHYTNPQCKPRLFESREDITWFADKCVDVVRACPGLTHVCPISQIMGFGLQVARQEMLPPFSCDIKPKKQISFLDKLSNFDFTDAKATEFLENIVEAQITAGLKIKNTRPNIKVLISHQWKPMKTKHSFGNLRQPIEKCVASIADNMCNQKFVAMVKAKDPKLQSFDGIALSVYPSLYFEDWKPDGNNCSGKLDPEAALEAIVQTAQAFPGKDIYIVETGCNLDNKTEIADKQKFVDMTLYVCQLAQEMGIPVKTCYFWGQNNDQYFEWNKVKDRKNSSKNDKAQFGPFDTMDPESMNPYGEYLKKVIS